LLVPLWQPVHRARPWRSAPPRRRARLPVPPCAPDPLPVPARPCCACCSNRSTAGRFTADGYSTVQARCSNLSKPARCSAPCTAGQHPRSAGLAAHGAVGGQRLGACGRGGPARAPPDQKGGSAHTTLALQAHSTSSSGLLASGGARRRGAVARWAVVHLVSELACASCAAGSWAGAESTISTATVRGEGTFMCNLSHPVPTSPTTTCTQHHPNPPPLLPRCGCAPTSWSTPTRSGSATARPSRCAAHDSRDPSRTAARCTAAQLPKGRPVHGWLLLSPVATLGWMPGARTQVAIADMIFDVLKDAWNEFEKRGQ
jgi:hypothetical protein